MLPVPYVAVVPRQITGQNYDAFVAEFIEAAVDKYGKSVMLQVFVLATVVFSSVEFYKLDQRWVSVYCAHHACKVTAVLFATRSSPFSAFAVLGPFCFI